MSAMSHEFDLSQAKRIPPAGNSAEPDENEFAERWDAVHEAAAAVAALAGINAGTMSRELAGLPHRAARAGGWAFEMAMHGVDDLAAMLQAGLRALLALTAEGRDTRAAALTLWQEFERARVAIQVLVAEH